MNKTRRTFFRTASATGIGETIASVMAFEMEMGRSFRLWTAFSNTAPSRVSFCQRNSIGKVLERRREAFRAKKAIGVHENNL